MMNKHFPFPGATFRYGSLHSISQSTTDSAIRISFDGVESRLSVPGSVSRTARIACKGATSFPTPVRACIAEVDGEIVAMEVVPADQMVEQDNWVSVIERNVAMFDGTGYWDGQYVYTFDETDIPTTDGFSVIPPTLLWNLHHLSKTEFGCVLDRVLIQYRVGDVYSITPPIVRGRDGRIQLDLDTVGEGDTGGTIVNEFADLDRIRFINLSFAVRASGVLSRAYGYAAVEPLSLPNLMVEHGTFNLGGIPRVTQLNSPIRMRFTEGLAWLIGTLRQAETLDQMKMSKSALKHLFGKGCTRQYVQRGEEAVSREATVLAIREAVQEKFPSFVSLTC